MATKNYSRAFSFIVLVIVTIYAFYDQTPHYNKDSDAPLNHFSTDRALVQLANIANKPHYVGTKAHEDVRNYIVKELEKLGLEVQIQKHEAVNSKWKGGTYAYNILSRIKGSGDGKALLLLSHYDSTPHSSYGGSDAGSGVVTILEGIRAYLHSGKKPVNDIIIVISDAEELGLLGAEAFVNFHPWAKDVGLVLNFEARGSGGPSYMLLETNGGNHALIEAFQKAQSPYPVGNSLMYSIYKMLPNDTDLTVFREEGNINGFNFAFIDDHFDYHSAQDTYERLDRKTLAHQGSYLMALLNYFSDADLTQLNNKSDDVFFNFPGFGMVYYPFSAVLPFVSLISIAFVFLFIYGIRKQKLSFSGSFRSFIPFLYTLLLAVAIGFLGWKFILFLYPKYKDILHGFPYNGHLYIAFFISLILAVLFWVYKRYFKKGAIPDLMIAPIIVLLILNFLLAFKLKGGGFFIIPLLGLFISWGVLL
ncbi:MAG TPA: M28 family peptidase, partial [Saprospiraceae bacterium]|nr:M28 family peptidase [Saprospiraceae bacterium]